VRKQYRELSKTMHPDKGGDPEQFKELIKAYKSLTDDETKRNWELYGNPDGPGGMPGVTIIIVITMALNGFFLLLPSYSFWHSVAQMDGR
jgi:preprotein translocase subunit Sec63